MSRTFALTIPQLPAPLSMVVANAYLLCRIADTIEDEPSLEPGQKRHFSQLFIDTIDGGSDVEQLARELHPLLSEATSSAERELIKHIGRVLGVTRCLPEEQRSILSHAVRTMTEGMSAFQAKHDGRGLKDMQQLDEYCYYVAGVVGEMLTELFCAQSQETRRNSESMMALAVSFGQGLQMTNILKDFWEDQQRGACWLPLDAFDLEGAELKELAVRKDEAFRQGVSELVGVARGHLENALAYTMLIPRRERGMRLFCLWAVGMAVLTLRRIHLTPGYSSGREVTISRRSVMGTIAVTRVCGASNTMLKLLFGAAMHGLPSSPSLGPVS